MSLNWNVTRISNYRENFPDGGTPEDRQWNPTTYALVMLAVPCAWGWELTSNNYKEAFTRINMYEVTRGAMRSKHGADGKAEEVYFTLDEVRKHIGLTVNVSPLTPAQWNSKLARIIREECTSTMMRELSEVK